jgi:hypothetical protein
VITGRFELPGVLLPEGDLLFYAIPVAKAGLAAHVAVANRVYIRLAAVVFDHVRVGWLNCRCRRCLLLCAMLQELFWSVWLALLRSWEELWGANAGEDEQRSGHARAIPS